MSASSLKPQLNSLTKHGNRITEWDLFRRQRLWKNGWKLKTGRNRIRDRVRLVPETSESVSDTRPSNRFQLWTVVTPKSSSSSETSPSSLKKASSTCLEAKILSAFMKNICHTELGLLHQLLLKCHISLNTIGSVLLGKLAMTKIKIDELWIIIETKDVSSAVGLRWPHLWEPALRPGLWLQYFGKVFNEYYSIHWIVFIL